MAPCTLLLWSFLSCLLLLLVFCLDESREGERERGGGEVRHRQTDREARERQLGEVEEKGRRVICPLFKHFNDSINAEKTWEEF